MLTGLLATASVGYADTPDTIDNPDALRTTIPGLASQPDWKKFATPEQIALFDGPQTQWPTAPASSYDASGFDPASLGSKLPPVGEHPRLFFSPDDVPGIAKRIAQSKTGQKAMIDTEAVLAHTLWEPQTDEGKVFGKLSSGALSGLEWPDGEGGLPNGVNTHWFKGYVQHYRTSVHDAYLPNLLAAAGFDCLLRGDTERGRAVAAALANYCKLRQPLIDRINNEYDKDKITPKDVWRPLHQISGGALVAMAYDVTASWMDDGQRGLVRRYLSAATYGKRSYGMNGPTRWRDTNWVGWDLAFFQTAMSIEGEQGYDPSIYNAALETARAYLDWGIDDRGTIFETNGKNVAGFQNELYSLAILARHGDNLFGHPHLTKLTAAQVQTYTPDGGACFNNGTWGGNTKFDGYSARMMRGFYPKDQDADWLVRSAEPAIADFDPDAYKKQMSDSASNINWSKLALLLPNQIFGMNDWAGARNPDGTLKEAWERDYLHLPLTFDDPNHGILSVRSGNDKDALFLHFEARPDLRGVGHQHHDSGQFYLCADGEIWAVEAGPKNAYSFDHNCILIDGRGHSDVGAAPRVGFTPPASDDGRLVMATANLKNAYDYGWTTPMHYFWTMKGNLDGHWNLSPDTDPEMVAYYKGTQHVKMRIWADNYWQFNWGPIMKIEGNPVRYAYRSAGVLRGKHPVAIVADDIDKDGNEHDYQWYMQIPNGVRFAHVLKGENCAGVVLTKAPTGAGSVNEDIPTGSSELAIFALGEGNVAASTMFMNQVRDELLPFRIEQLSTTSAPGSNPIKTRLVIDKRAVDPQYRILFVPVKEGQPMPAVNWSPDTGTAKIAWGRESETLTFSKGGDHSTHVRLSTADLQATKVK